MTSDRCNRRIAKMAAWFLPLSILFFAATECRAQSAREHEKAEVVSAGTGIAACPIGCDVERFVALFPEARWSGMFLLDRKRGVEARVRRGHIATLIVFFNSATQRRETALLSAEVHGLSVATYGKQFDFKGKTDTGIGAESSIDDVIGIYGQPEDRDDGAGLAVENKEVSLDYPSKGILFTFQNDRLSDIRIFRPSRPVVKRNPEDLREKMLGSWQLGLHSGGQALPFKREFLTGNVGPVLVLNADHSATYGIPCDIDETLNMKLNAVGRWELSDDGHFALPLMIQGDDVSIVGQVRIDEESDEIDHLVVDSENEAVFRFGRFDPVLLKCK